MMWTIEEALELIRELQPAMRRRNYHITLAGGVLNTGKSDKDLDLFFLKHNGFDYDDEPVRQYLYEFFGNLSPLRDSPDYIPDNIWHYKHMEKAIWNGKRIDIFIQ